MKKIILLIIILLILTTGCSSESATDPGNATVGTNSFDESAHADVPRILNFDSIQAYNELVAAANMNEDRLQTFLSRNNYNMNGIRTKEDILFLEKRMASAPFPVLKNGELVVFEINMDQHTVFVRYRMDSQKLIQFRIYLDAQSSKSRLSSALDSAGASVELLAVEETQELYYTGTEERGQKNVLTYVADANGYFIQIEIFDTLRKEADKQLQCTILDPLK